jgi:hypothetical protein
MNLVFSSKVQTQCRAAVENLFFFNPLQYRVRDDIVSALERYGEPRIEENGESLYLRVGADDAQSLFAFDSSRPNGDPVGVVVFLRTSRTDVVIVHIAVHPDYAFRGRHAASGLGLALMEKVKGIASQIRGIERMVLSYGQGITIPVRERNYVTAR